MSTKGGSRKRSTRAAPPPPRPAFPLYSPTSFLRSTQVSSRNAIISSTIRPKSRLQLNQGRRDSLPQRWSRLWLLIHMGHIPRPGIIFLGFLWMLMLASSQLTPGQYSHKTSSNFHRQPLCLSCDAYFHSMRRFLFLILPVLSAESRDPLSRQRGAASASSL